MKNTFKLFEIALIAVIGFLMIACDNNTGTNNNGGSTYTVTFVKNTTDNVTGLPSPITGVTDGAKITKPSADPVRSGFNFLGWFKEAATINAWDFATDIVIKNTTLYAKWIDENEEIIHKVDFETNGGTAVAQIKDVTSGTTITAPTAPTKDGYTFDAWYKEAALTNEWNFDSDTVTADITLYAKWNVIVPVFTVTFNSNGGTAVAQIIDVTSGTTITAPTAPTKGSFGSFDGWYKEAALTNEWNFDSDTVTANITLYAKWEAAFEIGDIGPGGGIIFYVTPNGFTVQGSPEGWSPAWTAYTAYYLEAAPENISETQQ